MATVLKAGGLRGAMPQEAVSMVELTEDSLVVRRAAGAAVKETGTVAREVLRVV